MRQITLDSVVMAGKHQVSTELGDETVILHIDDGIYFGLAGVGTTVWNLLQQPRTVREIRDWLLVEYNVERKRCESDLVALLEDLIERRLVEIAEPAEVVA